MHAFVVVDGRKLKLKCCAFLYCNFTAKEEQKQTEPTRVRVVPMAWRWFNATIMLLCVVLILALQGLPAPVTSSGWRVAETGERSPERSQSTGSSFAIAEPAVNFSFVAPSTRTAADPMVDLRSAPDRTADPYMVQTPGTAVRAAASLYGVQTRPVADPYVVLGVATAPRNTGHRAWIRETWMTLPNVVSHSTLSFFVVRHSK